MRCRALCCVSLSSNAKWARGQIRVASIICSLCERMIVFDSMKVKALRSISVCVFAWIYGAVVWELCCGRWLLHCTTPIEPHGLAMKDGTWMMTQRVATIPGIDVPVEG
jgi:hypothetical protein